MDNDAIYTSIWVLKCPICGKTFVSAPFHQWKIKMKGMNWKSVCSYSCMRVWEKEALKPKKKGETK